MLSSSTVSSGSFDLGMGMGVNSGLAFLESSAKPANSPTGCPSALVLLKSSSGSLMSGPSRVSIASSVTASSGDEGISGLDCRFFATYRPILLASGIRLASEVISTKRFLLSSAAFLSSFIFTLLWKTVARFGSTKAAMRPSLVRSLSIMAVISSSISI